MCCFRLCWRSAPMPLRLGNRPVEGQVAAGISPASGGVRPHTAPTVVRLADGGRNSVTRWVVSELAARMAPGQLAAAGERTELHWLVSKATTTLPCKDLPGCNEPAALPRPGRFRAGPSTLAAGAISTISSRQRLTRAPIC